jgi:hypothetical protein
MLRFLELLIRGHIHEWETIDQRQLEWSGGILGESGKCTRYYIRCKKCGWIRKIDCK